jgi:Etoposide-induced protein 2.4 (EI24)
MALTMSPLLLGLKDGLRPGLAWSSLMWMGAVLLAWGLGLALAPDHWWSLDSLGERLQAVASLNATVARILAAFLFVLAYVLLVIVSMALVILFVLMPRIRQTCLRAYPQLAPASGSLALLGPWRNAMWLLMSLGVGGGASLILPGLGSLIGVALVSYFNLRGLVYEALDGLATVAEQEQLLRRQRLPILGLGLALSAFGMVPVLGLLSPLVMGTSACHLAFQALLQQRGLRA